MPTNAKNAPNAVASISELRLYQGWITKAKSAPTAAHERLLKASVLTQTNKTKSSKKFIVVKLAIKV